MTGSIRRIQAIFIKDWQDFLKNQYMLFTALLPLLTAAWIKRAGDGSIEIMIWPITLAFVVAGSFLQAGTIAEEKEKNTLRNLLLTPVSTTEIFIAKSLLSSLLTIGIVVVVIYLSGFSLPPSLPLFFLAILISLMIYVAIGTILGLLSRTVIETSVVGMPVLILFGMGTMIKQAIDLPVLSRVIEYLPNESLIQITTGLEEGVPFSAISSHFFILLVWMIVSIVVTVYIYGKRRFD
ncbi:ABC transporter permease [Halalkalibacterium halodurans]|jgi:ABC-2 type transport system permease protein|uniref:BH3892 protein n=3 Tax=Halalkalibacterium halodurans TaxID=86665 RepID=Q9K640_HALH5|nr:ABC transporter permease [Halalkalibacterium halodurans]MDY7224395.1 ABC transporter permease [Halalkalibacterium halodurans]MDY7243680.1 ABC transporter permease [Halalkalibacterium halodurans]MED4123255.1 ABC transporter permease [Halalkalibacterium halodurans]TPE67163.1 ABC transporter permease [Halalkalibacterium halodurans]BAB07611.1 BH3892 [Halalkalibacterium halodurans C-125]